MKAQIFLLVFCFSLFFISCEQNILPEPETKALPVIDAIVSPGETILYNSPAVIKYTNKNASKCSINGQSVNCTSGEFNTGVLTQTTSYTIISTGEGGMATKTVTVNVITPNAPTLVVNKTEFKNNLNFGGETDFSWKAEGEITSVTLNGKDINKEDSYHTGRLFESTDFVLEVAGPGGKITEKFSVTVGNYTTSVFGLLSSKMWDREKKNFLDSQKNYMYTINYSVKESLVLNKDGNYIFYWDGKVVGNGKWDVSDDGKTLYLQGFSYEIKEINKNTFVLIDKVSNTDNYTESIYTHTP